MMMMMRNQQVMPPQGGVGVAAGGDPAAGGSAHPPTAVAAGNGQQPSSSLQKQANKYSAYLQYSRPSGSRVSRGGPSGRERGSVPKSVVNAPFLDEKEQVDFEAAIGTLFMEAAKGAEGEDDIDPDEIEHDEDGYDEQQEGDGEDEDEEVDADDFYEIPLVTKDGKPMSKLQSIRAQLKQFR